MSYKEILPFITTIILDIDGVLTDGSVEIHPHEEVRTMNAKDGFALRFASRMGYKIFVISGGNSPSYKEKLIANGVKEVILNSKNKIQSYELLKEKYKLNDEEVMYMGDDIPDYYLMKRVRLGVCPKDAAVEIKAIAAYQSPFGGGRHCVRDIIEQTMRVQGKWFNPETYDGE